MFQPWKHCFPEDYVVCQRSIEKRKRRRRKQWSHFLPNRCNPSWAGRLADLFAKVGLFISQVQAFCYFHCSNPPVYKNRYQKRRQTNSEPPEELSCQEASGREPEERGINGRAFREPNISLLSSREWYLCPYYPQSRQPWTRQRQGKAAVLRCSWGFCSQPEMMTTFTGYTFPTGYIFEVFFFFFF